jgi:hypothetical protein
MSPAERLDVGTAQPDPVTVDVLGGQVAGLDGVIDLAGLHAEQVCGIADPHDGLSFPVIPRFGTHCLSRYLIQRSVPMPFVRKNTADTRRLAELGRAEAAARHAVIDEVSRLRSEEGASWLDIAEALGTQRQNAHRRFKNYGWDPKRRRAVLDQWDPPAGKY